MGYLLKILNVFVLASIKYFWTPPYVKLLNLEFWETFLLLKPEEYLDSSSTTT